MRPLQLVVEGFTCFKDRQPPLDFSGLDLFAIAGPTGAGKTSLLDALLFALYGRVPRVGKSYGELISLGRDRLSVLLDFEVGKRRFRVTRVGRRARSGEAQLEELSNDGERPMAGGVHAVDAEIVDLLGLRYEAFTQAVVLPQGEFARFLKSQPRDRREILRDLLRLQVYERMRREAYERARETGVRLRSVEERLQQDYQDATRESLEKLREDTSALGNELETLSVELERARKELERRRSLRETAEKLGHHRRRLEQLSLENESIEQNAARLDAARRAAPLVSRFEAVDRLTKRASDESARVAAAARAWEEICRRHELVRNELAAARESAQEVPRLRETLRALDEVKGLLEPRETVRSRLREAKKKHGELSEEARSIGEELDRAGRRAEGLESQVRAVSEELKTLGYDPDVDRKLDQVRNEAVRLRDRRREAEQDEEEFTRKREVLSELESVAVEKEEQARAAAAEVEERRLGMRQAERELREAERHHAAAYLRDGLETGRKCPVCDRIVKKLPPPLQMTWIDVLRSSFEEARSAEAESRRVQDEKNRESAKAQAALDAARRESRELRTRADRSREATAELEQALASIAGPTGDDKEHEAIENRVLAAAERFRELRIRYESLTKRQQDAETERVRAQGELETSRRRLEASTKRQQELAEEMENDAKELARIEARIAEVSDTDDPRQEAERLVARIDERERVLRHAEESERAIGAAVVSAEKEAAEARRSWKTASEEAHEERQRVSTSVLEAGFENHEVARESVLAPEEQEQLDRRVIEFRQTCHALEKQAAELERELGGEWISGEEVALVEAEWSEKQRHYEATLQERAVWGQRIQELERKIRTATKLQRERESLARDHSVYRRLADDLRSERFQAYLLEESFRELVGGASKRLEKLSGRYTLEYREDAFLVLDHENAGERRSADTLSGGETFLASLALALELSEQVQRAAGAVNLDSLFIDEGFGTLDPETLDTVTAAIESLPVGGRMVGIITHIPELTERLPACIRVEKSVEGSRLVQNR